jgi:subtilisin-like proprotein convertase family protein
MKPRTLPLLALFATSVCVRAQLFEMGPVNQSIPDGSSSGLISVLDVSGLPAELAGIRVRLTLTPGAGGGFAGDLFVTLQHGSGLSVLLNRPGSRADQPSGYGDSQTFDFTLRDLADHDIHDYRLPITGSEVLPLSAPLTGEWQPDGRTGDPAVNPWASPRTAMLDVFEGTDPNGTWTLFLADLSVGGVYELNTWSVEITAVPEPEWAALVAGLGLLTWAVRRGRFGTGGPR